MNEYKGLLEQLMHIHKASRADKTIFLESAEAIEALQAENERLKSKPETKVETEPETKEDKRNAKRRPEKYW